MDNTNMISIILTVGISILGIVMLYVQYIISRKNEKIEIELKYHSNASVHKDSENGQACNGEKNSDVQENTLHKLLELYYNQALQQANIQFWFSIIAATLGFVFIFAVIFFGKGETWSESILKTFPGAIIEVISALFISQSRETRERATNLFGELHYDNKIEKSVEIADTIDDTAVKSDIKAKIALHIIGENGSDRSET